MMYIKSLQIQNFKSFKEVKIDFNPDVNIFTGENNSGKTTMLEAIALWQECFAKLLMQAKVGRAGKSATTYQKGDYILGNTQEKYFAFEQINSIRSPNFEDIFFQRKNNNPITLSAVLQQEKEEINIEFQIKSSGLNYAITLVDFKNYDFQKFNTFFQKFSNPINIYYVSPVSTILQSERFTTPPNIKDAVLKRESMMVLRNRLYGIYNNQSDTNLFTQFLNSLNYVLYGSNVNNIKFSEKTKLQKDTHVIYDFTIGAGDVEKDIALLGSGTLQIIELLINLFYKEGESDMNLILLDEPDSHIHRDVQQKLMTVIVQQSSKQQVFITTHSEAFIRSAYPKHLFHFDGKSETHYRAVPYQELEQLDKKTKSFKGIYPLQTNRIIKSLGGANGLDIVNAIEADKIIFVEGEDDAQVMYLLLNKSVEISKEYTQKYVFWVMGGISNIFKNILGYKMMLEQIRNEKTLWEKSFLVMDRDFLSDEHCQKITQAFKKELSLNAYLTNAYTFEATLLTDLPKLAILLERFLKTKDIEINTSIYNDLKKAYQDIKLALKERYLDNDSWHFSVSQNYKARQKEINIIFEKSHHISAPEGEFGLYYQKQIKNYLKNEEYYKLMKKEDVAWVINEVLKSYDIIFDIENDFIKLIKLVDRFDTWFEEWNFLRDNSR